MITRNFWEAPIERTLCLLTYMRLLHTLFYYSAILKDKHFFILMFFQMDVFYSKLLIISVLYKYR